MGQPKGVGVRVSLGEDYEVTDASNGNTTRRLDRLEKDLWYGNGKPGLTTRMAAAETAIVRLEECKAETSANGLVEARVTIIEQYIKERDNRLFARMNILLGGFVSLTVALIIYMLRH